MTRNYAEEDSVKKGMASLAVTLGASEGDVAQIDADGNLTLAATRGGGGSAPMFSAKRTLTSPEILALDVGYNIVPAQGPGAVIVLISCAAKYHFVSAPYVAGSDPSISVGVGTVDSNTNLSFLLPVQNLLTASVDTIINSVLTSTDSPWHADTFEDVGVDLSQFVGGAPTDGDGELTVVVFYSVLSASDLAV